MYRRRPFVPLPNGSSALINTTPQSKFLSFRELLCIARVSILLEYTDVVTIESLKELDIPSLFLLQQRAFT